MPAGPPFINPSILPSMFLGRAGSFCICFSQLLPDQSCLFACLLFIFGGSFAHAPLVATPVAPSSPWVCDRMRFGPCTLPATLRQARRLLLEIPPNIRAGAPAWALRGLLRRHQFPEGGANRRLRQKRLLPERSFFCKSKLSNATLRSGARHWHLVTHS